MFIDYEDWFYNVPNTFIRNEININNNSGVRLSSMPKRLSMIYSTLLFETNCIGNGKNLTLSDIYRLCSLVPTKKDNVYDDIIKIFKFLSIDNNYFTFINTDWSKITFNTKIRWMINKEKYESIDENYTQLKYCEYDKICSMDLSKSRKIKNDDVLNVFLNIKSYIFPRRYKEEIESYPEYCFRSVENIIQDLNIGRDKVEKCIELLTEKDGLLVKYNVNANSDFKNNGTYIGKIPNIYVLNKQGYEQEIKYAVKQVKEKLCGDKK